MHKMMIKNVRLAGYPSLFQTATYDGKDTGKYSAEFILDPSDKAHKKAINQVKMAFKAIVADHNNGKMLPAEKLCMRDGDTKTNDDGDIRPGFEGGVYIKAGNTRRPTIVDVDRSPLNESDDRPYGGCYVDLIIDFWWQNNKYGKRINCNLLGVQFREDGEPLGSAAASAMADDFDDLSGDVDDVDDVADVDDDDEDFPF